MFSSIPSRPLQCAIWLIVCVGMSVLPTINHFKGGHNKDYPLWYQTGQMVMANGQLPEGMHALTLGPDGRLDIYPKDHVFPFMYPPFAGVVLGVLSTLGAHPFFFALLLLNALSVAVAVELAIWLAAGTTRVSLALRVIPGAVCFFFFNDMFFLGQPNLGLLALVMAGLALVQSRRGVLAGPFFAAAAALKAYPVVAIVYLLWRRNWTAAASMATFTVVFLVLVPAPIRGFDRNLAELRTWADGMLFRHGSDGIGQRPEQSQSWQNQSIFGVGHRLLRHVDADVAHVNRKETPHIPLYVNLLDLDYKTTSLIVLAGCVVLGLGYIFVMPARQHRTQSTDAAELAMLVILITIGTPYAYTYYAVWMLLPYTVLVHRALTDPDSTVRRVCTGAIVASAVWYAIGVPINDNHFMQAIGAMFWAEMTLLASLGWLLRAGRTSFASRPVQPCRILAKDRDELLNQV